MTVIENDVTFQDAPKASRKLNLKVLLLFVVLPLVVVGGGAAVLMSGILKKEPDAASLAPVFYDLPEFLVNLRGVTPQHFLKMKVALQINSKEDIARLDAEMPRVLDGFQVFLRELRPEDLEGSGAMARLKEELLRRINLTIQPPIVSDVLFKDIIVQ